MKCPTCPISMWYYDTMEPEGEGQDKVREPLALDMYIRQEGTHPALQPRASFSFDFRAEAGKGTSEPILIRGAK